MARFVLFFLWLLPISIAGQIQGTITSEGVPLAGATVFVESLRQGTLSEADGRFRLNDIPEGSHTLVISYVGFVPQKIKIDHRKLTRLSPVDLLPDDSLDEVVLSSQLREVNRLQSTIPVEVYAPSFLQKNPTPNLFEGIQFINGIRPQINCAVCNTGDIHINGLEGPYTMVLIDGMPIVSSLASVYGLNGIPPAMIEKIEIIKGPSGTLYGSQAVGGLINVITKLPEYSPKFFADVYGTTWQEYNADLGLTIPLGKKASALTGINVYNYATPIDQNNDNFTDVTLQKRFSVFQKLSWQTGGQKQNIALRYLYEDRWGGEMQWTPAERGGSNIYGESIYTSRFELLGNHALNGTLKVQYSYTDHQQNSAYGDTPYIGEEQIGFAQLIWQKQTGKSQWLGGVSTRFNRYDDNTIATAEGNKNAPNQRWIPGVFIENESSISPKNKILLGLRLDHHQNHGVIFTPRAGYKYQWDDQTLLRLNFGTGFRVVNIFTEDHASLTGARELIIDNDLQPEASWNVNMNFFKKIYTTGGWIFGIDASAWHTYFSNQIIPDYDSNPNQIRYANLDGHAVSQGIGLNFNAVANRFTAQVGVNFLDVYLAENGQRERPLFTEKWSGTWTISIPLQDDKINMDYTGNIFGSMRLPVLNEEDPRTAQSPVWSIQNIKFNYKKDNDWIFFLGVKNLLNWTPAKNNPFLIARANDPFDRNVAFDNAGNALATPNNPNALTFDPTYAYAPNQGIRVFLGCNFLLQ